MRAFYGHSVPTGRRNFLAHPNFLVERLWTRALAGVWAVGVLLSAGVAQANTNLNTPLVTVAIPQTDSPVKIEACGAIANDYENNTVDPPAYAYTEIEAEVSFRDVAQSAAVAVKFGFAPVDSFNNIIGAGASGTVTGSYAPGVLIQPHRAGLENVLQSDASAWTMDVSQQDVHGVLCFVQSVRLEDGTIWNANLTAEIQYDKQHGLLPP